MFLNVFELFKELFGTEHGGQTMLYIQKQVSFTLIPSTTYNFGGRMSATYVQTGDSGLEIFRIYGWFDSLNI